MAGIATTNYDCITEAAYRAKGGPVQKIVPFLSNTDLVDEKLRDPSSVALLKLHGCITRAHDRELPLILTIDQYATYRDGRSRLFQMLEEWASENTIVFIGHRLQNLNLRGIASLQGAGADYLKRCVFFPQNISKFRLTMISIMILF